MVKEALDKKRLSDGPTDEQICEQDNYYLKPTKMADDKELCTFMSGRKIIRPTNQQTDMRVYKGSYTSHRSIIYPQ